MSNRWTAYLEGLVGDLTWIADGASRDFVERAASDYLRTSLDYMEAPQKVIIAEIHSETDAESFSAMIKAKTLKTEAEAHARAMLVSEGHTLAPEHQALYEKEEHERRNAAFLETPMMREAAASSVSCILYDD